MVDQLRSILSGASKSGAHYGRVLDSLDTNHDGVLDKRDTDNKGLRSWFDFYNKFKHNKQYQTSVQINDVINATASYTLDKEAGTIGPNAKIKDPKARQRYFSNFVESARGTIQYEADARAKKAAEDYAKKYIADEKVGEEGRNNLTALAKKAAADKHITLTERGYYMLATTGAKFADGSEVDPKALQNGDVVRFDLNKIGYKNYLTDPNKDCPKGKTLCSASKPFNVALLGKNRDNFIVAAPDKDGKHGTTLSSMAVQYLKDKGELVNGKNINTVIEAIRNDDVNKELIHGEKKDILTIGDVFYMPDLSKLALEKKAAAEAAKKAGTPAAPAK